MFKNKKGQTIIPLPPNIKIPVGVALIFYGLYLLNLNNNLGLLAIIGGIILVVG